MFIAVLVACAQDVEQGQALSATEPHEEITTCLSSLDGLPPEFRDDDRASDGQLIVVYKRFQKVALYTDGQLEPGACWDVALGAWPYEAKTKRDNKSTPEGWYEVARKRTAWPLDLYPDSTYAQALHVSYPNRNDVMRAWRLGIVDEPTVDRLLQQIRTGELPDQDTNMGGGILIHTWDEVFVATLGCVGLPESEMSLLFAEVGEGTPILLLPWSRAISKDGTYSVEPIPRQ